MKRRRRCPVASLGLLSLLLGPGAPADEAPAVTVDFARQIRPIPAEKCFPCHGLDAEKRKGDLRLDTAEGLFAEVDDGFAVVRGDPEASVLYQRVVHESPRQRMPPSKWKKELSRDEIELVRKWIEEGAAWEQHWSLVPLVAPRVPAARAASGDGNEIDAFIRARLEKEGLSPSPEADRTTLIRRVSLDLTGLPPAPEEVDAFLADGSEDAYERVVDHLLGSTHYGEHMARYWLDAARYGDTHGLHLDNLRQIWPYRDWVIEAFNANMRFDQFTIEQLAGDLLPDATVEQRTATGFCRANVTTSEGGVIPEEYDVHYTVDRVATMSTVWMGISMGCVRCHEHKFDPFEMKDFYQLYAFFNSLDGPVMDDNAPLPAPVLKAPNRANRPKIAALETEIEALRQSIESAAAAAGTDAATAGTDAAAAGTDTVAGDACQMSAALAGLEKERRRLETEGAIETLVWKDAASPRPAHILIRGEYDKPGERVERDMPAALPPLPATMEGRTPTRLDLARWLVSPEHPLTARVTVNRFWQQYFGVGIVETTEDFGSQGAQPTHPGLLDWLAVEFRESDWDVKRLQKLIVMSKTYRQSAAVTPELLARDPANRLLARGPRFRLDVEVIRDSALAVSGLLVRRIGGPGVRPYQPPGIWEAVGYTDSNTVKYTRDSGEALYRRSVYTFWKRTAPPPSMVAFDAPSRETCTVRRSRTNTPLAALTLMNDEQFVEASRNLAQRVIREGGATPPERASYAFRAVTSRRPSQEELETVIEILATHRARYESDREAAGKLIRVGDSEPPDAIDESLLAAWTMTCNLLLNLDEFVTKG